MCILFIKSSRSECYIYDITLLHHATNCSSYKQFSPVQLFQWNVVEPLEHLK